MNLDRRPETVVLGRVPGVHGLLLELPSGNLRDLRGREGWPGKLWEALTEVCSDRNVADGSLELVHASERHGDPTVDTWKQLLSHSDATPADRMARDLLPVPVPVEGGGACIVSWSPHWTELHRIGEVPSAVNGNGVDPASQRDYYFESILGCLHGVDVTDFRDSKYEAENATRLGEVVETEGAMIREKGYLGHHQTKGARILAEH